MKRNRRVPRDPGGCWPWPVEDAAESEAKMGSARMADRGTAEWCIRGCPCVAPETVNGFLNSDSEVASGCCWGFTGERKDAEAAAEFNDACATFRGTTPIMHAVPCRIVPFRPRAFCAAHGLENSMFSQFPDPRPSSQRLTSPMDRKEERACLAAPEGNPNTVTQQSFRAVPWPPG